MYLSSSSAETCFITTNNLWDCSASLPCLYLYSVWGHLSLRKIWSSLSVLSVNNTGIWWVNIQHGLHASYGIFLLKQSEQTFKLLEIKKTQTVDLYTMWGKTRIITWAELPGAEQKTRHLQIIELCCSVVKLYCPSSTEWQRSNSVLLYSHLLQKKNQSNLVLEPLQTYFLIVC